MAVRLALAGLPIATEQETTNFVEPPERGIIDGEVRLF
jgi:hypothetical protein